MGKAEKGGDFLSELETEIVFQAERRRPILYCGCSASSC